MDNKTTEDQIDKLFTSSELYEPNFNGSRNGIIFNPEKFKAKLLQIVREAKLGALKDIELNEEIPQEVKDTLWKENSLYRSAKRQLKGDK